VSRERRRSPRVRASPAGAGRRQATDDGRQRTTAERAPNGSVPGPERAERETPSCDAVGRA
jgi:hypothetical protein